MPVKIGLDTSFIVGLLDEKDIWHRPAMEILDAFQGSDYRPMVFDCVLAEVISTLARRLSEKRREAELKILLAQLQRQFPTKSITWLYPDLPRLYDDVLNLVKKTDGRLNFNDSLIALSCESRRIPLLASFDADFDRVEWLQRVAGAADLKST